MKRLNEKIEGRGQIYNVSIYSGIANDASHEHCKLKSSSGEERGIGLTLRPGEISESDRLSIAYLHEPEDALRGGYFLLYNHNTKVKYYYPKAFEYPMTTVPEKIRVYWERIILRFLKYFSVFLGVVAGFIAAFEYKSIMSFFIAAFAVFIAIYVIAFFIHTAYSYFTGSYYSSRAKSFMDSFENSQQYHRILEKMQQLDRMS